MVFYVPYFKWAAAFIVVFFATTAMDDIHAVFGHLRLDLAEISMYGQAISEYCPDVAFLDPFQQALNLH